MKKPEFVEIELNAVEGNKLCDFVAKHFDSESLTPDDICEVILQHKFGHESAFDYCDDLLFELIIEEEDYCNDDDTYNRVLGFIAEEFGGHFNINFLNMCAYM